MSLTKPILSDIPAFDKSNGKAFYFMSSGGSQAIKNELRIMNNETNEVIYQQIQESFKLEHILPPNILINGLYYKADLRTYDVNGNFSVWSNTIQFYCYTTPVVTIDNLPLNGIIENAKYRFVGTYNQIENERLNSYTFSLYSDGGVELATSGNLYVSTPPPNSIEYEFVGFDDNKNYYIIVNIVTVNNTLASSDKINFSVKYTKPSSFSVLELKNNYCDGTVDLATNIVDIQGKSNPDPPIYIDDKMIDLRGDGHYVIWDDGYDINGDFTLRAWGERFNYNKNIIYLMNPAGHNIQINFSEMKPNRIIAELYAYDNDDTPIYVYSNEISKLKYIFIWVRRISNVYEIKIEGGDDIDWDLYYTKQETYSRAEAEGVLTYKIERL